MKKTDTRDNEKNNTSCLTTAEKTCLFNTQEVKEKAKNAKVVKITAILRQLLKQAEKRMNVWFQEGRNIAALVHGRAWLIDQFVTFAWNYCQAKEETNQPALLAVGGYGRGELHPESDVDLLILFEYIKDHPSVPYVEKFIALLWDMGLKASSKVCSLDECSSQAADDISWLTALMESRVLLGNTALKQKLDKKIAPGSMWPVSHFLPVKYEEQKRKHSKYNQTSYNLEPDVKESPGGLRDIHLTRWITLRQYGKNDLSLLVEKGLLLDEEYQLLQKACRLLWHIRWMLHMTSGRTEERLLFDYQRIIAEQNGLVDNAESLAIEQFMQGYYRAVTNISTIKDLLVQRFHEDVISSSSPMKIAPVNERFQLKNHYLEITHADVFPERPSAIIELFMLIAHNSSILGIRASTIRSLRAHLYLVDDQFRQDKEVNSLFMKLMKAPYRLTSALSQMAKYEVLGRYLPEFAHIAGQMQYDLFHIYTVDAHTLLVIRFLRQFRYASSKDNFPLAYNAMRTIKAPELLYIAAFYHDIAKGRGGDHSELGAKYSRDFCHQHAIPEKDSALVIWLVKHHLSLSMTAQRSDLTDLQTIYEFAKLVGSTERLDYLLCLTVADINATNPKLWNGWRATLIGTLYNESRKILMSKEPLPTKTAYISTCKAKVIRSLVERKANISRARSWWNKVGDDYFSRYSPEEIVWHTTHMLEQPDDGKPFIISGSVEDLYSESTALFIYAPYTPERFVAITSTIEYLNFNIKDAKVVVSAHHYCMDTFVIMGADNTFISSASARIKNACKQLKKYLDNSDYPRKPQKRRTPRLLRYFSQLPEIRFSEDTYNHRTIIEVFTVDRPGVLAVIVDTFLKHSILVQNAKILTFGERVEDVFFVTRNDGKPLEGTENREKLEQALVKRLTEHTLKDSYPAMSVQTKNTHHA